MIYHLLLLFFIVNLFISLLAVNGVNTLPLEASPSLGSNIEPALPQLNVDYEALTPDANQTEYLQSLLNFESDGSTYCPHIEILTIILNVLRNLLPLSSEKVKHVLSNYYTMLENVLNSSYSVESLNKFSSENRLNYMDFLAHKLIRMNDKNAKLKISLEYELPTIHKAKCEKFCNDLINFANAETSTFNDLNYANEQGKMKNNIMTFLQNYRPDNNNSNLKKYIPLMNKPDYFNPPNSDALPSNVVSSNMPISNPLQSLSQLPSNQTEAPISDHPHMLAPLLQSPTDTDINSNQDSSLPVLSPTANERLLFLQNFAAWPRPSLTETANAATQSKQPLLHQLLGPKAQNPMPVPQTYTGSSNSYPLQGLGQLVGINPLQMLGPHSYIPNGAANPFALLNYTNPLPNIKGNINPLQNAAHFPQKPVVLDDSYPTQNLLLQLQGLTENSKDIENFAKIVNLNHNANKVSQYHYETQKVINNNKVENTMQNISKNNETVATPTTSENRWSLPTYLSGNNKYSNNEKLLQKNPILLYNLNEQPSPNLGLGVNERDLANLYHNLNTNALSSIKQYESGKLQMDSSSAHASSLDRYKQYLQSVKNLNYPQNNPITGYLLNQQIPYSSQSLYPFSYEKNNAIYNSYVQNMNQLGTHSNMPSTLGLYPNTYYYYNPNLGITNIAKNTQENYGVQFQDLNRLLGVSNLDRLNSATSKNGIVELTYRLKHTKPSPKPFFYVKFRLPYDVFLFNLHKLLLEKPNLRNDLPLLLKHLIVDSNITSSSVIKSLNKEELLGFLNTNDTPVTARVLDAKDATASEQIKIVQRLNANMPLKDIFKTDANITKVSELTTNIPSINYLRNRPNYLNDLQRTIPVNRYLFYPYKTPANQNLNQYVQHLTYLNRKPILKYNYLPKTPINPYYSYGLNSFSRYRYTG